MAFSAGRTPTAPLLGEETMKEEMTGKVALVTGAAAGIGRATAVAFAERGARVVVSDIDDAGGEETVRLIERMGVEAVFVQADVSSSSEVESLVRRSVETFGRLDFAFNNAGIEGESAPVQDCTEANWDRVMAINLKGTWLCMKYEIPVMSEQGGGTIVNCSSVAGLVGFSGIPAYTASKHGIIGLTKSAALENAGANIRINVVCPGVIRTAMVERFTGGSAEAEEQLVAQEPMGRMGTPEEVASAVLWLCSDGAGFVTGHSLVVDGGWVAR
jgi:NAD(P)-dependent dehydrogenase (short-subunit alcohol dehydrogenase family)